ncbi:hypothetical protein [Alteromonas sp. C1M14]|uniref:hypothetical protein n=1 Tax=Alteromonas sp. C1M14 TaxID=2841567 RepID=UPI001C091BE7|nr:hypothetical protein [Alteromonas sp. C1M14]MBU2978048.1 hypothetical protein [Alteromonas sp. C1M14]
MSSLTPNKTLNRAIILALSAGISITLVACGGGQSSEDTFSVIPPLADTSITEVSDDTNEAPSSPDNTGTLDQQQDKDQNANDDC